MISDDTSSFSFSLFRKLSGFKKLYITGVIMMVCVAFYATYFSTPIVSAATTAIVSLPFNYPFNGTWQVNQTSSVSFSGSPYWWVSAGGPLDIANGVASNPAGSFYSPFTMFFRQSFQNISAQVYVERVTDTLSNTANRQPYIGDSLIFRYQDPNNYYYAGIRADGYAVIKKKVNGVFETLATKKIFSGTYNQTSSYDLIPLQEWIGLKTVVMNSSSNVPMIYLYTDVGRTGSWELALTATDDPKLYGAGITAAGLVGVQNDYATANFDDFYLSDPAGTIASPVAPVPPPSLTSYDSTVLSSNPVMYLAMNTPNSGTENDLSGHGHVGTYKGGTPSLATLPNGDQAADFNGTSQYAIVPSSSDLSISTTHQLTWEGWVRADTLNFPVASGDGYVDWMGKCESYSPTCEWEARMYGSNTSQDRPERLSAYVFNPSAGLGSAADWQPASGVISPGEWVYVVAEYQTLSTPSACDSSYPGTINIWVNGIEQSFASHMPTGCMSQYQISPKSESSPLTIGTMAFDTWFKGAIGKIAIYDRLLSQSEINAHFQAMTGVLPSGSCGQTCTVPVTP